MWRLRLGASLAGSRRRLLESPLLPNEQSVAILETMDVIATQDRDHAAAQRGRL